MQKQDPHTRLLANSTKTLCNALTPEQRTRFDQMASRYGKRHGTLGNGQPPVPAASATVR